MKKRILSLLLALVLAVSLLPVNIFADSGVAKPAAKINHGYVTGLKFAINGNEVQPSGFETNTPSYDVVLPDTLSSSLFSMTLSEEYQLVSAVPSQLSTEVPSANAVIGTSAITKHNASRRLRIFFFIFLPPK